MGSSCRLSGRSGLSRRPGQSASAGDGAVRDGGMLARPGTWPGSSMRTRRGLDAATTGAGRAGCGGLSMAYSYITVFT